MRIRISGISEAIKHIERYEQSLDSKQNELVDKLADVGVEVATEGYGAAFYDGTKDISVSKESGQHSGSAKVVATGSTVAFVEFGTGVHYPEQHPKAGEFGAVRGGYGHHLGRLDSWRYPEENGGGTPDPKYPGYVTTHGNPPSYSMYEAGKDMRAKIGEIAKEVYGNG